MERMGDKIAARQVALECDVPVIPGVEREISDHNELMEVRKVFFLFYVKIMVAGDGQFYRGFGGYWVLWFLGCGCE